MFSERLTAQTSCWWGAYANQYVCDQTFRTCAFSPFLSFLIQVSSFSLSPSPPPLGKEPRYLLHLADQAMRPSHVQEKWSHECSPWRPSCPLLGPKLPASYGHSLSEKQSNGTSMLLFKLRSRRIVKDPSRTCIKMRKKLSGMFLFFLFFSQL